jgi:hypothetical protein
MLGHLPVCVADALPVGPVAGVVLVAVDPLEPVDPVELVAALAIAAPPPASAPVTANTANAVFIDLMMWFISYERGLMNHIQASSPVLDV